MLWAQRSFQNHHQTSTIDVWKKSDISRKNRTTGSSGHVQKISNWPQPVDGTPPGTALEIEFDLDFSISITQLSPQLQLTRGGPLGPCIPGPRGSIINYRLLRLLQWHKINSIVVDLRKNNTHILPPSTDSGVFAGVKFQTRCSWSQVTISRL